LLLLVLLAALPLRRPLLGSASGGIVLLTVRGLCVLLLARANRRRGYLLVLRIGVVLVSWRAGRWCRRT
jgi:hypothetical protein